MHIKSKTRQISVLKLGAGFKVTSSCTGWRRL